MPIIEKRYAQALVDLALQHNSIDKYEKQLDEVALIVEKNKTFRECLLNPKVKADVKKALLTDIFSFAGGEIVNLLKLLVDKRRMSSIGGIAAEFKKLADEKRNVIFIHIISATELDPAQIQAIETKYMRLYHSSRNRVTTEIDQKLLGGIKIVIGDRVIDGSVKGRLEALRSQLVKV